MPGGPSLRRLHRENLASEVWQRVSYVRCSPPPFPPHCSRRRRPAMPCLDARMRVLIVAATVAGCLAVPCVLPVASAADGPPLRSVIDGSILAAWQREKITPAPRADDTEFLRRLYLDLVGTIPMYYEAKSFLDDGDAGKREKLIDKLLADPRFATAQADVWDLVFFGRHPAGDEATRKRDGFKRWLAEKF